MIILFSRISLLFLLVFIYYLFFLVSSFGLLHFFRLLRCLFFHLRFSSRFRKTSNKYRLLWYINRQHMNQSRSDRNTVTSTTRGYLLYADYGFNKARTTSQQSPCQLATRCVTCNLLNVRSR